MSASQPDYGASRKPSEGDGRASEGDGRVRFGVFSDMNEAESAVRLLLAAGFAQHEVTLDADGPGRRRIRVTIEAPEPHARELIARAERIFEALKKRN